jgi:squalene-associated FAD-dependent desaturase
VDRVAHALARPLNPLRVAVVGAGWAGIAAAVHARRGGHEVEVFEMAPQPGGRARSVQTVGRTLDNGQHVLIGAYRATLELMHEVGATVPSLLCRLPLALQYPDGRGLCLRGGAPVPAFVRAVLDHRGWTWSERLSLLAATTRWAAMRFRCNPNLTVGALCRRLPASVREQLIEPLCVAALNTPPSQASARVFLRVLRDALFGSPGSSDLLLPRAPLGTLLPQPAAAWFQRHGVGLHTAVRVTQLESAAGSWQLDGRPYDAVLLACSAAEAARLCRDFAPAWSDMAGALRYEPIVTVYLFCPGARLALPMVALHANADAPAQFAFDLGALGSAASVFAFVISGAHEWVEKGLQFTAASTLSQALAAFPPSTWPAVPTVLHVSAEKRATFRCTPGLQRPPASIAPGLWAAGDYVDGPYPATLEGAVLSGRQAAHSLPSPSETTRHAPADTEMQSDIPQCRTAQRPPQWPS